MYKWILTVLMLLAVMGCNEDMTAQIGELTAGVRTVSGLVEQYQAATNEMAESLKDTGVIDDEIMEKLSEINDEIDKVQPQIADIADAIDETELSKDPILAVIQALQAGNAASTPFNPYALPVGGILAAIGGLYGASKRQETKVVTKKYKAANQGMEKFRMNNPTVATALYADVGEARKNNGV